MIVDCEAGLEHLSRKTLGTIDIAFIISDVSRKGVQTAVNQVRLMEEINIEPEKVFLLVNNIPENLKMPDLNAANINSAMSMVAGTARSMGITVEE